MAQNWLTMTFLLCPPYDIITWAGQSIKLGNKKEGLVFLTFF